MRRFWQSIRRGIRLFKAGYQAGMRAGESDDDDG